MTSFSFSKYERPTYISLMEVFSNVFRNGLITSEDRIKLKETLLEESVTKEDLLIVNRLIYAVRRKMLKLGS